MASAMKSGLLLDPYDPTAVGMRSGGCFRALNPKHTAIIAGIYSLNIAILVIFISSWRISVDSRKVASFEDVYYGVQIAYLVIIGTQMFMLFLSITLLLGIYKENFNLIIPWVIGSITFMALEAVAMVYSNVLREHVNKEFDHLCKAEVSFFVSRTLINILAISWVMRFCNLLRAGIHWKMPEIIEL